MEQTQTQSYSAFEGVNLLSQGSLEEVVLTVKRRLKSKSDASILVFSDLTGKQMDFDLRGTEKEVVQRLKVYLVPDAEKSQAGPGRPKLGVVAREISLLPRHWEWLSTQSGGASAVLRRLVETEMKGSTQKERIKQTQESTYKFLSSIAGNLGHYEEVIRALYAKDFKEFKDSMSGWPIDIKQHAISLSESVFEK